MDTLILLVTFGAVFNQLAITYLQTNSFIAYTYTDERFYFGRSKFFEALYSYHIGLFVYVPLMFISLFGIPFLPKRQRFILPLFFFFILFLYASWWYWPILKRALIDFYAIPAIFLGALLNASEQRKWKVVLMSILGLTVIYYQFKNMQLKNGIIEEYTNYKEIFWRNFFRTEKANIYLVQPSTIMGEETFTEGFEENNYNGNRTNGKKHSGNYSLLLDPEHYISKVTECKFPGIFNKSGCKKIRFSFYCDFDEGVNMIHAFMHFYKNEKVILEVPFYVSEDHIFPGKWDYKEFGYEIVDSTALNKNTVDKITFSIWNVEGKKNAYFDDAKVEFILTDRSFETVK